ncbi:hypothetical protein METP3_03082 [Methanosarcinales archaeon]|nr:hypothetical protein METP3_03082 [Methanosarcinales archaeon]
MYDEYYVPKLATLKNSIKRVYITKKLLYGEYDFFKIWWLFSLY